MISFVRYISYLQNHWKNSLNADFQPPSQIFLTSILDNLHENYLQATLENTNFPLKMSPKLVDYLSYTRTS